MNRHSSRGAEEKDEWKREKEREIRTSTRDQRDLREATPQNDYPHHKPTPSHTSPKVDQESAYTAVRTSKRSPLSLIHYHNENNAPSSYRMDFDADFKKIDR